MPEEHYARYTLRAASARYLQHCKGTVVVRSAVERSILPVTILFRCAWSDHSYVVDVAKMWNLSTLAPALIAAYVSI